MKKLFTLLMAATLAIGSYAKDYTDELVVDVTGLPKTTTTSTISVDAQDNGKYTFLLKDFSFSGIPIGDINLTDVEGSTVNGTTYLRTAQPVNVNLMGSSISLPIILRAEIAEDKLKADMDIAGMPGMAIHVTFAGGGDLGGFQIPNSGFEDYYTYTNHNNIQEPLYWHSFASAGGSLASFVNGTKHTEPSTEVRPGSTGKSSLKVTSSSIVTIIANGTITTGRMNAGGFTASDKANHAQIDMSSTDKDGHGDPYYVALNGQPDSLDVWVAFKQGTPNSKYPYATVSAITTDGSYYQDPEDTTYSNKRAEAKDAQIATTFTGNTVTWKKLSIPFSEVNKGITPKTILVTMSTNAAAGQGSGSDELYIDDLSLIYNLPTVKGISFKGQTLKFDENNIAKIETSGTVSSSDFSVETEGALGAHVNTYINTAKDENDKDVPVAYIIVTSGDYKKFQTYTVSLPGATTSAIKSIATDNNSSKTELYNLAGQRISNTQPGQIVIVKKGDKAVKVLK
jgi:hypothetical protein